VIIGTQKGGTTSLYRHLITHPQIAPAREKELHYFSYRYGNGPMWYRAQFPAELPAGTIVGEGSPYYLFHPHAARRLREHAPHAKLIVLLRNPVDRAWSHYHHAVRRGYEPLSFEEAIAHEGPRLSGETARLLADEYYVSINHQRFSYLARGCYAEQLRTWFAEFPRDRFLILESEAFFGDPPGVTRQTIGFLGLEPDARMAFAEHVRPAKPPMARRTRERLTAYFAEANAALRDELGLELGWIGG
jgi:hypothetical protein